MSANIYTVIMAGGVGSRFWPQSRENKPKQFIDILGIGKSLLQMTYERALKSSDPDHILFLTNNQYRNLILEQVPSLDPSNILTEPSRNNTAPCIAYAAVKLYAKDPQAVMIVLPSDHLILKEDIYLDKINLAIQFAKENKALLTLGIEPTRPDTGYGYIQFLKQDGRIKKVTSFKEKPDSSTAEAYLNSGNYLWNAGIFIWKAAEIMEAFKLYTPDLLEIFISGIDLFNTDSEQDFILKNYPKSPNISIDYAIMEKAENVYTIPADIGWSDLGTWASLWNVKQKDENKNVLIDENNIQLTNTQNCIISKAVADRLLVIDGLQDYIIIDEKDVLLIYPKAKEQDIKTIIKELNKNKAENYL